ncbi:MAG: glycosyltransferase family A protein [Gammaproteobacteria bacterium]
MGGHAALVTIGIPTFNRARLLARAIDSALAQSHKAIEVVICDNASTDDTDEVCRAYVEKDARVKYYRNPKNIGGTSNFAEVLRHASGDCFMWLGDDDRIDMNYVEECVQHLESEPELALVGGEPIYEKSGAIVGKGQIVDLDAKAPWARVVSYYARVSDNGLFYGVMRTRDIRRVRIANVLGGDWCVIAGVAFLGRVRMIPDVLIHREMGGATASFNSICASLGISRVHALLPSLSIGLNAFWDVAAANPVYGARSMCERVAMAGVVFLTIIMRAAWRNVRAVPRMVRRTVVGRGRERKA